MVSPDTNQMGEEDDGYFNDLSQQQNGQNGDEIPKAKRIACVLCRKRKLKCDGNRPSCSTCTRLSHDCSYDEVRKKSGPRRGYVRQLEARLAQVETMLKSGDAPSKSASPSGNKDTGSPNQTPGSDVCRDRSDGAYPGCGEGTAPHPRPNGEVMNLGLDEPLPSAEVVEDLNRLYFQKVHPTAPLIHPGRYYAAMRLSPAQQPPVCLRYAMWAMTASLIDKYDDLQDHFYTRARKYIQRDEMAGHGENLITLQHVQTWYLIAMLEFKMTYFPRAWMSSGRSARLAQMMGLHRVDNMGLDVKQCLPPPKDWSDKEERRRTFWMCFAGDRFASIGTGWPMSFDEADIHTNLPVDDESFEHNHPIEGLSLEKALTPEGASQISSFGGVAIMACLFGRNLLHLHRGTPNDAESNMNGKFWTRHRTIDNSLLNISLSLPDHLRLPNGLHDLNTVFLNLCIHTSTICLHQAAIYKAEANNLAQHVAAESKVRCITAAAEIASIMRMISHLDLTTANPFTSFCLYVGARVFVQYLKSRPQDNNVKASLHFMLTAMQALRRKNLLTESLLVQLDLDLQGAGLEESRSLRNRLSKAQSDMNFMEKRRRDVEQRRAKELQEKGSSNLPTSLAFGDNGISSHSDPAVFNLQNGSHAASSRINSISDSEPSPAANGVGVDFSRVRFMPSRTKTPSTRPSPATVSDEAMDFVLDNVSSTSPASLQQVSSHNSVNSQTPPLFVERDSQASVATVSSTNGMDLNLDTMTNEEFQAIMGQYSQVIDTADMTNPTNKASMHSNNVIIGGTGDNNAFTMPYFDSTNDQFLNDMQNVGSTGFTPGPSGDLLNISDAEWKQIIDSGMVDMGWEGLGAGKQYEKSMNR